VHMYIEYVCFVFASSCKRGIRQPRLICLISLVCDQLYNTNNKTGAFLWEQEKRTLANPIILELFRLFFSDRNINYVGEMRQKRMGVI